MRSGDHPKGGPAGTGPLVAAARLGLFAGWRVAVVERSAQLCAGALGHYQLESTSRAATFLEALQGEWCTRAARSEATKRGLRPIGLLGVLRDAKVGGLVTDVRPLLDDLRLRVGFWVSDATYAAVLTDLGELP